MQSHLRVILRSAQPNGTVLKEVEILEECIVKYPANPPDGSNDTVALNIDSPMHLKAVSRPID